MKGSKWLRALVFTASAIAMLGSGQAQASADASLTLDEAYPGGLPAGSLALDDHTLVLDSGDILTVGIFAVEDCPEMHQCWWKQTNFSGGSLFVHDVGSNGIPWTDVPNTFDNAMESWRNRDGQDAKWAKGSNGNGEQFCMDEHSRDSNVGPSNLDTMSSYRVFGSGSNPC
ncbi:MAG: peptidase inhibitor family I36 protein [Actinomycetota bacterium]